MTHHLEVLPDREEVAERGAALIADRARATVGATGRFSLALSGGHTPEDMLRVLADHDLPWPSIDVWQVDERVAPAGDPDRNLTGLLAALKDPDKVRIHPMPVEEPDLDGAAAAYAAALPSALDLVHLGLGPDGHTASLVPNDPVLDVADRDVAITGPYMGRRRMTMTYPMLARSREILWLVTGSDKADPLRRLVGHDRSIPAGRVEAPKQIIVVDREAASGV